MTCKYNLCSLPKCKSEKRFLLETLISYWYRPLQSNDGYTENDIVNASNRLSINIPIALQEWYLQCGKLEDVWSSQDLFLSPDKLFLEDECLIFYVENQNVVRWGVPVSELELEDPKVVLITSDNHDNIFVQAKNVSNFAIYMFEYALQFNDNNFWINGFANDKVLSIIENKFRKYDFPDNWWTGTKIYGDKDIIVCVDMSNCVQVSTKNKDRYNIVSKLLLDSGFETNATYLE